MENTLKHGEYYTCQRLRLLEYLMKRGFTPVTDVPDPKNWKYRHWIFKNSEELEAVLVEYFDKITKKEA